MPLSLLKVSITDRKSGKPSYFEGRAFGLQLCSQSSSEVGHGVGFERAVDWRLKKLQFIQNPVDVCEKSVKNLMDTFVEFHQQYLAQKCTVFFLFILAKKLSYIGIEFNFQWRLSIFITNIPKFLFVVGQTKTDIELNFISTIV